MKIKQLFVLLLSISFIVGPAYAKNDKGNMKAKTLPPGLHKKEEKGKPLPPGWQKKLSRGDILDDSIYARGRVVVPLGKDGSVTIDVEGTIIRLHEKTRRIIDIVNE